MRAWPRLLLRVREWVRLQLRLRLRVWVWVREVPKRGMRQARLRAKKRLRAMKCAQRPVRLRWP